MDSTEWHFRLGGDDYDISGITDLFGAEVKIIKDDKGQTQLVMNLPFASDQLEDAQKAAAELLAKLNAIAQIMYGNHENLLIVGFGCKDPSGGPMHQFIGVGSGIRSRARVGGSLTVISSNSESPEVISPPKHIGDQFLDAADRNEHLERALYLFGSLPLDWRGLYLVLDAAAEANGGERGLISKNWVPNGQIKAFKATADSYKAIRLEARHGGVKKGIDKPTITLPVARDMIRTILEKWAKASI